MNRFTTMVLVAFASAATSLAQSPSVTFLGMDTTTLGNWRGVYGQDGFVLPDYSLNAPPYTGFGTIEINQRLLDIWSCSANHTCDPRQPNKQPYSYTSAERVESYYYNRMYDDFQLSTNDGATHRIALYFCDYEFYGRQVQVVAHNTSTGATLDTRLLSNYSGGVYLIYNYTGAVDFEVIDNITPTTDLIPNGTISGFFWGGSGGPPSPTPSGPVVNFNPLGIQSGAILSGTVQIQVSLDDGPGVSSVQLQLDGQNLGAPMYYFVTDILAQPVNLPFNYSWDTTTATNCTHTITAIASDANGYQAASPPLSITVSNGAPNCGGTPTPAAAPIFNPTGGTYSTAQQVSLSTTTSGASIRYTIDGSMPTETHGTLYNTTTPINVGSNTTINAIAYMGGIPDSTVSTAVYTINTGGGGGGGGSSTLALVQSNASATSSPGSSSQSVSFSASVASGDTLFVFAQYYNPAVTASASDTCGDQFTQITGSPVTVSSGTAHWFIAKSANGGTCTVTVSYSSSTSYGGVAIFEVSGLGGTAVALDRTGSGTGNGGLATATITPTQANSFAIAQLWSGGGGAAALGAPWTSQERVRFSTLYQSNIAGWRILNSTAPVQLAANVGGGPWIAMIANFYASGGPPPSQVATPTFSPAAGSYTTPVSIGTITGGATIRYTTDGTIPTETHGTVYSTPISLASTTTIMAIAYEAGFTDSAVASATYTVGGGTVATPTFLLPPGPYTQPVGISTTTLGATIRYTTDGTTPTETHGTVYSTAITLTATTTIKAIAYEAGFTDSAVASGTFTVGSSGFNAALVQSWATGSSFPGSSNLSTAFQSPVASGNTIFVLAQYYSPAVTATASDNCNDTFTQISGSPVAFTSPGANGTAHWFIARNVTGGACTVKVTFSSPTNYGGVAVFEVSGLGGLSATLDQYASGTGTGSLASASITPTQANSFAIAQVWSDGGGGFSLGNGWTTQERTRFSTIYQSNMAGWQVLSSTAPVSLAAGVGGGPWIAMIANFY
jgi:Chitobiase/beta-hexosaminidase C-terminal domain/Bacterial Ig domain